MTLYELIRERKYRDRLKEILKVFFEEEFGYFISKIKIHHHLPFHKRIKAHIAKERTIDHPTRLRKAFERLGPTFIKFGQLLSLRPDLVPPEFIEEFEKMQDKVPTFPYSIAKKTIEEELKKPLDKLFTSFPKKPIASASIAQVYKAKIGNKTVAVKVQRPNIAQQMESDIQIMYKVAELMEQHITILKEYNIKGIIHEFEKWTIKELNFEIEAYYAQRIAKNFQGNKSVKIPQGCPKLTTSKVLTMEFLEGIPLHDVEKIKKKKIDIKKVIKNGYQIFLKQVFVDGFFHADPHPGNILVLKDGRIGLIDFGILGHFDKKLKRYALDIFHTFINNDPDQAVKIILRMNPSTDIDPEAFRNDLRDIFEHVHCTPMEQLQIGPLIKQTLASANKHHLKIPVDFVLYGKTIAILEGVAVRYHPDFDVPGESKKVLENLFDYKFFTKEVIEKTKAKVSEYSELADIFPEYAKEILEKARKFRFNIDIEDQDVSNLTLEMERSSGNLALGMIIAALIVGSSLTIRLTQQHLLNTAGFILAGVLSLWLIHRTIFVKTKKNKN